MSYQLREYQQRAVNELFRFWRDRQGERPILTLPTGSGKSIIIAEIVRTAFENWPAHHPRAVILVPSKELAEQNAEKLRAVLPPHLTVGYYSAALGKKDSEADVIVATIGSIYRDAHILGTVKIVLIDECHLINPSGEGRYQQFLAELARLNTFVAAGLTATPFRGNGVWLTEGEKPFFSGVAHTVTIEELLEDKFLSPLVRPIDVLETRIDTAGIKTTSGDYNLHDLSERIEGYIPDVVRETMILAADRRKWIAFTASVQNAQYMVGLMKNAGITAELVCGETAKSEREAHVAAFRRGEIRCLVTVLALATGFDVPDVDCVIWVRPTQSPVLYVQGAGRGMRIADGKTDCLWLDFSDTTERLGPVDTIKGRRARKKNDDEETKAPTKACAHCGDQMPIALMVCPSCGEEQPEKEEEEERQRQEVEASNAAIMARQQAAKRRVRYDVTRVAYSRHDKPGKPSSLRVEYYSGLMVAASEWVCLSHEGYPRTKAEFWWAKRSETQFVPHDAQDALEWIKRGHKLAEPKAIFVNEIGKYPEIVGYEFEAQNDSIFA